MPVIAKLGLLEKRGKVRTDAGEFEVRPSDVDGWVVEAPAGEEPGLVKYDPNYQILQIERPEITITIRFRPELERTTFELNDRTYEVGSMDLGNIRIALDGQNVVRGHLTVSGVHLNSVSPDLKPLERELAFGLTLRNAYGDERFWRRE